MATKRNADGLVAGKAKAGLRQTGQFVIHPTDCGCRKCRRMRKARAGRVKPRYGQTPEQ